MSESNGRLDLSDLTPIEEPFAWDGKEYLLREPSEATAKLYLKSRFKGSRQADGSIQLDPEQAVDSQTVLVQGCLSQRGKDGAWRPVSVAEVLALPRRLTKKLYDRAEVIGGLADGTPRTPEETREKVADLRRRADELEARLDADGGPEGNPTAAGGTT